MRLKTSKKQRKISKSRSNPASKKLETPVGSSMISSKRSKKQTKSSKRRLNPASKKLETPVSRSRISSKRSKILSGRTFIMAVIAGFIFSLAIIFFFIFQKPIQSKSSLPAGNIVAASKQEQISQPDSQAGKPLRLSIPKIGVNAAIESVGLTSKGAVGVPKVPSSAAWYNLGARPGDIGSAVITGHYGPWIDGRISVFDNLYKLKKGDKINIKDDKGEIITFVVRELKSYDSNAKVAEIFISTDGKSHLNIITCAGVWNKATKSYSKRLVVFADKE